MSDTRKVEAWIRFFNDVIEALEKGQIAVDALDGLTLGQMKDASEQGFDKFDEAIEAARRASRQPEA